MDQMIKFIEEKVDHGEHAEENILKNGRLQ